MEKLHQVTDPDYYTRRSKQISEGDYNVMILSMDYQYNSPHSIRWHWHDEIELYYQVSGDAYLTCEDQSFLVSEGEIVFINQHTKHFITPSDPDQCIFHSILVHPHFIFGFGQLDMEKKYIQPVLLCNALKFLHITKEHPLYELFFQHCTEILFLNENAEPGYELLTKSSLLILWKALFDTVTTLEPNNLRKTSNQDEQRVKDAILYIQEHFTEQISLDDIANSIMVSKSECCRCFKRTLDVTPFEYLMKYRIMESTRQMNRKRSESISEIAGNVGFNNTSYFNKIFKKYMNCTPTEYRKNQKK
ncbi:MAG: helix-turn-helix transcriptional regulator [Lachnospiraceae bacterium]|nr:helix-turn-helix transcriptional regulator [Lachnospiraceae bacterium]